MTFRINCIGLAMLAVIGFVGGSCSKAGSASTADHETIGHWQGTITSENGRKTYGALLIDASERPLRVALTYYSIGANYTGCATVEPGEGFVNFQYKRASYDLRFEASLSADGRLLSGTITAAEGSKSSKGTGTFEFVRTPRAVDLPGAMRFSKGMTGAVGDYTLTITLGETEDGRWVGQLDSPEMSLDELPLFDVTKNEDMIRGVIQSFGPPWIFEMRIAEDRQRLTGVWKQGGSVTELDLPRVN